MSFKLKLRVLTMALAFTGVIACSTEHKEAVVSKVSAVENNQSIGKMTAPIAIEYQISNPKATIGEAVKVTVNFTSKIKSPIQTNMATPKQLTLVSPTKQWQSSVTEKGGWNNQPEIEVLAEKAGTYYLDFVAFIEVDGQRMGKAFSIPVQIGEPDTTLENNNVKVDDKGQKIKVYKADEN